MGRVEVAQSAALGGARPQSVALTPTPPAIWAQGELGLGGPLGFGGHPSALVTASSIGSSNRIRVLYCLVEHGPLSRADLARIVRVPRGSVAPIVAGLLADGMLIEGEARLEPAKTGKPSRPLWFGPAISPPIAVQVQASRVVSARISQGGHVVQRLEETLSPKMRASEIETLVVDLAREILGTGPTCGVGLAWPAVWDHADGTVLSCTPIPALNGSTLLPQLTAALDARVFPQDDARALALGQQWFGEARGTRNLAALQISAGIGAGVVIDGRAFAADGQFPEVGHMCVQLDGALCACGRRGCWETVGSLEWLRRQAGRLNWPNSESATPGDFVRAPGPAAAKVLEEYARNIAVGLVNMATCLGVRRFLLHGEVVTGGQRLEAMVRDRVARGACLPGTPDIQVDFSKLNQEAGLLGAAALPLAHAIEGV